MEIFNKALHGGRARPELLILLLIVTIIAMLVIPLPTYLVDFLIGLNILIAVLILMGSFYIERILQFSTFPAVLLITTLFRLALTISTSRLILLQADAGDIVATFGQFVIGDSLAVGFVVFSIVTVVQFIVITKGSERVAEVAARFSLDGMPGKQMSIDSDLKAGIIDAAAARERRSVLERESQLYGSFDGAMKFIKGDAIAGIIIIFVNFIGGISVGMSQHGMNFSTALSTYTMLTIGDGLIGQIPALLISISAGFIVTRVNGDGDNLGQNIINQLLGKPLVILITALLILVIGLLPGFPTLIFMGLSGLLAMLYFSKHTAFKKNKMQSKSLTNSSSLSELGAGSELDETALKSDLNVINSLDQVSAETVPLILLVPQKRLAQLEKIQLGDRFRSQFFVDYGVRLPDLMLRSSTSLDDNKVCVLINEIRAEEFVVYFDLLRVVDYKEEISDLGITLTLSDNNNTPYAWVEQSARDILSQLGYQVRPAVDELYQCLASLLARNINEYFGVQETKNMLDQLETKYPDLLKEVYRHATVQRVAEVLQRLLLERISVRNMKLIMESLAYWAPREKDVLNLVEHVRTALGRYICHKFSTVNELRVLLVSADVEAVIRKGIRQTSGGAFLNLEPAEAEDVLDKFALALKETTIAQRDLVVLASVDLRRFIKKFIESRYRELDVLSFGEITESVSINVIRAI